MGECPDMGIWVKAPISLNFLQKFVWVSFENTFIDRYQVRIYPKPYNPLKPIEYLYFNIYNHCYQRSSHSGEFLARFQAMYLFSLSVAGWILLMQTVYLRMIEHSWFSSRPGAMTFAVTIYLLTAAISHRIFIIKEQDQKIFGKYEESWNNSPYKKRDLMISLFIMVVPYILLVSIATFFPRES